MKALAPWMPFRELSTFPRDFDDLFARFFGPEEEWWPAPARWGVMPPAVESFVRNGQLIVRADLPGIDPKKVELSIEGNRLFIRGEREEKEERKEKDFLHREVRYGKFERALDLPVGVDTESIKATYHEGVLEIAMTAPKEMVAKKVPISVH
jgi:HSP20 family protein